MDEETTTVVSADNGGQSIDGVAIDDQGMAIPQPESTDQNSAEQQPTDVTSQEAPQSAEPSSDDNSTTEWLKKKGVDPTSPEAIEKVAEMARNAEKAMHAKAQKASELEKSVEQVADQEVISYEENTGEVISETDKMVRKLVVKDSVRTFFDANPDAKQYEQAMIAELQKKPHLAGDLESLYANAVVNSGGIDSVKSQAKKDTLESLAQKQTASVPRGSAVNSSNMAGNAITPQNVDQLVATMSPEEYRKRLPEINAAMAG